MTKLYQVVNKTSETIPVSYFSTKSMAVEQALVFLISVAENVKAAIISEGKVDRFFSKGDYFYNDDNGNYKRVNLTKAEMKIPYSYGSISLVAPPYEEITLSDSEENDTWLNYYDRIVYEYNRKYLELLNQYKNDIIGCLNQRIAALNKTLENAFIANNNFLKEFEDCQKRLVFNNWNVKSIQTSQSLFIKEISITIDEVIKADLPST